MANIKTMIRAFRTFCLFVLLGVSFTGACFAQAQLRPGDTFELHLGGMPEEFGREFLGNYVIGEDGTVGIPDIGPVHAAGLTPAQLQVSIQNKLVEQKIFTKPIASVTLPTTSRYVTVGGEVRAPQAIPWAADLTLSAGIKRAGGPTEFGNLKKVKLTREGKTLRLNTLKADKDPTQNPKLLPGDEVEVLQ